MKTGEQGNYERLGALLLQARAKALTEKEREELNDCLRQDPQARAFAAQWLADDVSVAEELRVSEVGKILQPEVAVDAPVILPRARPFTAAPWLALAAGLTLLLGVGWILLGKTGRANSLLRATEVTGTVSWRSEGGKMVPQIATGQKLAAGVFMAEGDGAGAELLFADGTRITLGAGAELAIQEKDRKRLFLRAGDFSADVKPQPPGRPMIITTPTAEIEVVGTSFAVTTISNATAVNVEKGVVRLRRVKDGQMVEVPARKMGVASADGTGPLVARSPQPIPLSWQFIAGRDHPDYLRGTLLAEGDSKDFTPRLAALPYVAKTNPDGEKVIRCGVAIRGRVDQFEQFVKLRASSVITLKYRTAKPAVVAIMLSTLRGGASFGGNFEAKLSLPPHNAQAGQRQASEWQTATIPVSSMRPIQIGYGANPAGTNLRLLLISVATAADGLEVAEVAIQPGSEMKSANRN